MKSKFVTVCLFLIAAMIGQSCKDGKPAEGIQEIPATGQISSIIRNPESAQGPEDTTNVARMVFEEDYYAFGEVIQGDVVERTFTFTNTGSVPLIISDARSTCGCTVPSYPKTPIAPGASDEILVRFDTKGKFAQQRKTVTITSNAYPNQNTVTLEGYVIDPTPPKTVE